ncbi:MAG: insulinase family protein [Deltaproteobacteria bacterium]|nr:insulinase family protein [Nannocystaceae bacterium]
MSSLSLAMMLAVAPASASAAAAPAPSKETAPAPPAARARAAKPVAGPKPTAAEAKSPAPGEVVTLSGSIPGLGVTMSLKHFVLANGLRVYVLEDHSTPSFALQIAYDVGSRDEVSGRTGFAHFFEHMMFKGSQNVPDGGHFKHVLGVGGQMNAFTSNDVTVYFDVLPSQYLDMGLWLESDRLRSLAITDENFENQRSAVKEEKAMRVDNVPYAKAMQEFFAQAWANSGYGHITIGSEADLSAATTADVKAFFDKYYVPNNAVMVLVGDVELNEAKTKIEKYFGDIPRGTDREAFAPVDHAQTKLTKRVVDKLAQQPLYVLGWKTVPENHPDRHAVELMMSILLEGDSSRITKILVDEKKLAVAAVPLPSGSAGGHAAGSAFAAFVPVTGVGLDKIEPVVRAEVENLKKKGVSANDLKKAINAKTVGTVEQLATNTGRAILVGMGATLDRDPLYVLSDLERFRKVKPADIKRVANTYLTDNWMVIEIVPPQ